VFGGLFAVNSSLHSYLILAFTRAERVTMDVGFYYMANAAGRLIGTVLSGLTYQIGGLPMTLGTAAVMLVCSAWAAGHLRAAPGATGAVGRPSGGRRESPAGERIFTAMWVSDRSAADAGHPGQNAALHGPTGPASKNPFAIQGPEGQLSGSVT
jgi:hypothetical protein